MTFIPSKFCIFFRDRFRDKEIRWVRVFKAYDKSGNFKIEIHAENFTEAREILIKEHGDEAKGWDIEVM